MTIKTGLLPTLAALTFAASGGSALAADAACKPVTDALVKLAGTPNHARMHVTAAYQSAPTDGETITTARVTDDVAPKVLYMSMHFADGVNNLTNTALDPMSKMPELKHCAVKVETIKEA